MFNGFSDKTTDFLWGIRFNNERTWFLEHKQEYMQYLQQPLNELGKDVFDIFTEKYGEKNLLLHVSRIYRDARRLHGRGPYKERLWFSIRLNCDNWDEHPVYWFEIAPEGYSCGMGFYTHRTAMMENFRKSINDNPQRLLTLAEDFEKQDYFLLEGDEYRRPKGTPGGILNKWYNRKKIDLVHYGDDYNHYRPEFASELAGRYGSLMPLFEYFNTLPPVQE